MSIKSVMPSRHLILCHPFSSCPQSLPASESFPMSQLFAWGGQSIGVSALALVLPMNIHVICGMLECFPGGAEVKASACNVGDLGLTPGSGRSPGEGDGNPLQYSCLENPMDRGAWWATVHGSQRVGCDWATSFSLSLSWYARICRM